MDLRPNHAWVAGGGRDVGGGGSAAAHGRKDTRLFPWHLPNALTCRRRAKREALSHARELGEGEERDAEQGQKRGEVTCEGLREGRREGE